MNVDWLFILLFAVGLYFAPRGDKAWAWVLWTVAELGLLAMAFLMNGMP